VTRPLATGGHLYSGKVRDLYDLGDGNLLLVTSDRISAFDVVMNEPIPDKGRVLTAMTVFWCELLSGGGVGLATHLVSAGAGVPPDLTGRALVVRRAEMLPLECIVRGYLAGSGWKEYRANGTLHGEPLPAGLRESELLPALLFTPSTKATEGHDENITPVAAAALVGADVLEEARRICTAAYELAAAHAAERGVIIADTKFELGWIDGRLAICDEILTPDSSRFWPADRWSPGAAPPSWDKQPLRDWLEASGWDKKSPPPALPAGVVAAIRERYVTAYERISGRSFADWPGA